MGRREARADEDGERGGEGSEEGKGSGVGDRLRTSRLARALREGVKERTILTIIQFLSTLSIHTPLPFPPSSAPPTLLISGSLAPTPLSAHRTTSIALMMRFESDSVGSPHCS